MHFPIKKAFFPLLALAVFTLGAAPPTPPATRPAKIVFSLELLATPDGQDKPDEKKLQEYRSAADKVIEVKANTNPWKTRDEWNKDPQYCKNLDTPALALECFQTPTIGFELSKYSSPIGGFLELWVAHNSFSELLSRDDMWIGMSRVLEQMSQTLADPKTEFSKIVTTSMITTSVIDLSRLAPMRQQLKGHEAEYLKTLIKTLKAYQTRLDATQTGSAGFFGEPTWLVSLALDYVKIIDPKNYNDIESRIHSFKFQKEQRLDDLKQYLNIAIPALEIALTGRPDPKMDVRPF